MFTLEDIFSILVICSSLTASVLICVQYLERRHKQDLDFEKKRIEAETENSLLKARIYADKDIRVANLESQVLANLNQESYQGNDGELNNLINLVLQNPDMLKPILDKLGLNQPKN